MELSEGKVQWPFFTNGGDNYVGFKKKKGNSFTTNTLNKNAAEAKQPKK